MSTGRKRKKDDEENNFSLHQALSNILKSFGIDKDSSIFDDGHPTIFEEFILKTTIPELKPVKIHSYQHAKYQLDLDQQFPNQTCFFYQISPETAQTVVNRLNELFPSIEASYNAEFQASFKTLAGRFDDSNKRRMLIENTHAFSGVVLIDTNSMGRSGLLAAFQHYLHKNPQIVEYYQLYPFDWETVHSRLQTFFAKHGMSISDTDCFEETLCRLVKRKTLQDPSHNTQDDEIIQAIETTNSQFYLNPILFNTTSISLSVTTKQGLIIADYFNQIKPDSATAYEKKTSSEEKSSQSRTILRVRNSVLLHPQFASDLAKELEITPKEICQKYRELSKSLVVTSPPAETKKDQDPVPLVADALSKFGINAQRVTVPSPQVPAEENDRSQRMKCTIL